MGVCVASLVALLVGPGSPAAVLEPISAADAPSALGQDDSVQIHRRVLTVEAPPVTSVRAVVSRTQKAPRVTRTNTAPRPFLARARQLVFGDGRVRPSPFPKPAN